MDKVTLSGHSSANRPPLGKKAIDSVLERVQVITSPLGTWRDWSEAKGVLPGVPARNARPASWTSQHVNE